MLTRRRMITAALACGSALVVLPAAAADAPGGTAADATMTCEQIAAELMPYMQQIMPSAMAAGATAKEVKQRGEQRVAENVPAAVAITAAATASHADPTGAAGRAVGQAEIAMQQQTWQRSMVEDKPLRDKYAAQTGQLAAQGQQMQSNARLQRLMQLVQEKHCDAK